MTDLSSYTHKWRATTNTIHPDTNKISKRNRQPTSCQSCRTRKLKCDKGHPCDACTKRGEQDHCQYGKLATSTQSNHKDDGKGSSRAQERLRHLEELVKQMISPTNGNIQTSPKPQEKDQTEAPLDRDRHGTSYTGSTHWSAILDQIQELRTALPQESTPSDNTSDLNDDGPQGTAILGAVNPLPLPILIQTFLPQRQQVDRYLSTYFKATYMVIPFVHVKQFQRQYERFWENQTQASPMWLSILFSILYLADLIKQGQDMSSDKTQSPSYSNTRELFLVASAQCLVLGDYTKPQPNLIEALAMYAQCKYSATLDPSREMSLIFTILVRQAYTMGYHRDPSNYPGQFTPFEGELRRRCWTAFKQFDLMISFQLGIPQNIMPETSDTQLPRNILDQDFDEDTQTLPPPRPDTEATQMLYFLEKARIMEVYSKVVQQDLGFPSKPPTSADIMAIDASIRQASATIVPVLQARPMSMSYSDPSNVVMLRINLMFITQKSFCVLHRKYMVGSGQQAEYSRKACVEASIKVVTYFIDVNNEFKSGGQLSNDRWMLSSFIINDFLLAAMLLFFATYHSRQRFIKAGGNLQTWLEKDEEAKTHCDLLAKAQQACEEYGQRSQETRRVAQVLATARHEFALSPKPINGQNGGVMNNKHTTSNFNITPSTTGSSPSRLQTSDNSKKFTPSSLSSSTDNQSFTTKAQLPSTITIPTHSPFPQTDTTTHHPRDTINIDMSATWTYNPAPTITPQDPLLPPSYPTIPDQFTSILSPNNSNEIDWRAFDQFLLHYTPPTPQPPLRLDDGMHLDSDGGYENGSGAGAGGVMGIGMNDWNGGYNDHHAAGHGGGIVNGKGANGNGNGNEDEGGEGEGEGGIGWRIWSQGKGKGIVEVNKGILGGWGGMKP